MRDLHQTIRRSIAVVAQITMKTYEIEVEYRKTYSVQAKNATEANRRLVEEIERDEFALDVQGDYSEVEDEPITCPDCQGDCIDKSSLRDASEAPDCPRCNGEGEIIPEEYHDDESDYR